MPHSAIPITEVLVVADCWQDEPDAEAVIQRAIAIAAATVDTDVADAEQMVGRVQVGGDALVLLNDAFFPDAVLIDVPAGVVVPHPVLIQRMRPQILVHLLPKVIQTVGGQIGFHQ